MVTNEEHAMLAEIAVSEGLTPSDIVRQFIRKRYGELKGGTPKGGKRRRKR